VTVKKKKKCKTLLVQKSGPEEQISGGEENGVESSVACVLSRRVEGNWGRGGVSERDRRFCVVEGRKGKKAIKSLFCLEKETADSGKKNPQRGGAQKLYGTGGRRKGDQMEKEREKDM